MSKMIIVSYLLFTLLIYTAGLNIIPDSQNPIQIKYPNKASNPSIVLRFSLAEGSAGLNYKQFLAVSFPKAIGTSDLLFDQYSSKWTCELTDSNGAAYKVTAVPGLLSPQGFGVENNVAYCQLDDYVNYLKHGVSYIFTLGLSVNIASTNFINGVGLFLCTSNNAEKVIIDSAPVFGNFGLYNNWETITPKPLDITGTPQISIGKIIPYSTFDVTINFKVNSLIENTETFVIVKYNPLLVNAPVSISSDKISDDPLKGPLAVTLQPFTNESVLISGVTDNLIPGREFKLTLKQFKALDNISIDKSLKVIVYYKNTYSILSYASVDVFNIVPGDINITSIAHPEQWDIWRNGAWPIKFTFKPTSDINNNSYVLIQHTNAKDTVNKLSFIASTCDFSDFSDINNSFGTRPSCYPLRHDHDYPNKSSTDDYSGSGIFFNVKSLLSSKDYTLTVWIFADNCGGNDIANFNLIGNSTNSSVTFNFKITVLKDIDSSALDENRLLNNNSFIIAQSGKTNMTGECWNAAIQSLTNVGINNPFIQLDPNNNPMAFTNDLISSITIDQNPDNFSALQIDIALYKEIYDFGITSATSATSTTGYGNMLSDNTKFTEAFLYGNSKIADGSYFLMRGKLQVIELTPIFYLLSLPVTLSGGLKFTLSKMIFMFSKDWFVQGDSDCYASWGFHGAFDSAQQTLSTNFNSKANWNNLIYDATNTPYIALSTNNTPDDTSDDIRTEGVNNFISNKFNLTPTQAVTIDTTHSVLNPNAFKIVSTKMNLYRTKAEIYSDVTNNASITNSATWLPVNPKQLETNLNNTKPLYIGLFTSCLKWKATLPTIKSLYTYIDIQWNFTYKDITNRVNRFIKLYPEGGVFQDYAKFDTTKLSNTNPLMMHYAYINSNTRGVCLIELNTGSLTALGDDGANALVLWIYYGTLLETDYQIAANYPINSLANGVSAYGLQNGTPQSRENLYYNNTNSLVTGTKGLIDSLTSNPASGTVTQTTFYHAYFASVVILTGINKSVVTTSANNAQAPILIPFYCPYTVDTNNANNTFANTKLPMVIGAWMNLVSFNNITQLNKFIGYKNTNNDGTRYSMIMNKITTAVNAPGGNASVKINLQVPNIVNITLRFNPYTKTLNSQTNILYLYNTFNGSANQAQNCTGQLLFINKSIALDQNVTFTGFANNVNTYTYSNLNSTFYVLGKKFNSVAMSGIYPSTYTYSDNDTSTTITAGNLNSSSYYWTGIRRPTVDSFINFNTNDYFAYYCTSVANNIQLLMSNYVKEANSFILDYSADTLASWGSPNLNFDRREIYKGDVASNIIAVVVPPTSLPKDSNIVLTSASFTDNTICGLVLTQGAIAKECTNTTKILTCLTNGGATFSICCYNISISNTFTFTKADVTFNTNKYNTPLMYSSAQQITNNNPYTFNTGAATAADISADNFQATITKVAFSNVNQVNGYGKVIFTVQLPREPVRDMKLTFSGDFSNLLISPNIKPRCVATFGDQFGDWEDGDALIDTCSADNIANADSPILLTTKKIIYKCGLAFTKRLLITLWPVKVYNWPVNNDSKYKVMMQLNKGDNIANNTHGFNMPQVDGINTTSVVSQNEGLCTISSIFPKISGESADYIIQFDTVTNKNALTTSLPNEFTIFLPFNLYGSYQDVSCYYNNALLNCVFTDEGILQIRFNTQIPTDSKVTITISGLINPTTTDDIYLPCTINKVDYSTNNRTNLIVGYAKMGGFTIVPTATGVLRFLNQNTSLSNNNPRNSAKYILRFTFDLSNNLSTLPITLNENPVLLISFPKEFDLSYYNDKNVNVKLDAFKADSNTNIINATFAVIGNRIKVQLPQSAYTFDSGFRFFEMSLDGIKGPLDTTNSISLFNVLLMNTSTTVYFKTYNNFDTTFSNVNSNIDKWLAYTRGYSYSFDNTKWIVDMNNNNNEINTVSIKQGRFTSVNITIRQNVSLSMLPSSAMLTLSDSNFKLSAATNIFTNINNFNLMLGTPCSTASGNYIINFTLTVPNTNPPTSNNWAPLAPIQVFVSFPDTAIITYKDVSDVVKGGSSLIYFNLSEPNVDDLNITFNASDGSEKSAAINNLIIKSGALNQLSTTFSITSSSFTGSVNYTINNVNKCYSLDRNSITINVSKDSTFTTLAINPFTLNANTNIAKNSVQLSLTLPFAPVYYYCILTCYLSAYPSDNDIKSAASQSGLDRYVSGIYSATNAQLGIEFKNILRGQIYKAKCILETMEADFSKRQTQSFEIPKVNTTPIGQYTYCANYSFIQQPSQDIKATLVNYCQRIFADPNGCVICTDDQKTYQMPGYKNTLLDEIMCTNPTYKLSVPDSLLAVKTVDNTVFSFNVCAIPSQACSTDPIGYVDKFTKFTNDIKDPPSFKALYNFEANSLNSVTIRNDNNIPILSNVKVTDLVAQIGGYVSFKLTSNNMLRCYYMISKDTKLPTFDEMLTCNTLPCGYIFTKGENSVTVYNVNFTGTTSETIFFIYLACYNDIPFAHNQTSVIIASQFYSPNVIIPVDYNLIPKFTYYNAANNNSNQLPDRNSIKFTVKFEFAPVKLYCALVCFESQFPDDVKSAAIANVNSKSQTKLVKYYSGQYTNDVSANGLSIIFTELIRGQKYKLKCFIETNHDDVLKRSNATGIFLNFTDSNNKTVDIYPSDPDTLKCAAFEINFNLTNIDRIALMNYCQGIYNNTWENNGCTVCTDPNITYKQLTAPIVPTCTTNDLTNRRRFLEATNPATAAITALISSNATSMIPLIAGQNNSYVISVCAIPNPSCTSDMLGKKTFVELFNNFTMNLNTTDNFNSHLKPTNKTNLAKIVQYDDSTYPDITQLNMTVVQTKLNGYVNFIAYYPDIIRCYYYISNSPTPPEYSFIESCSKDLCGKFYPYKDGVDVSTTMDQFKPLTTNTNYSIYVGCENYLPSSIMKTNITVGATFVSAKDINSITNLDTSGNFDGSSHSSSSGQNYQRFEYILLLGLILIGLF
jgi:hypothetical protein